MKARIEPVEASFAAHRAAVERLAAFVSRNNKRRGVDSLGNELRKEMGRLGERVIAFTPPFDKGLSSGTKIVKRDIERVFFTAAIAEKFYDKSFADALKRLAAAGNVLALETIFRRRGSRKEAITGPLRDAKVLREVDPAMHQRRRNARGLGHGLHPADCAARRPRERRMERSGGRVRHTPARLGFPPWPRRGRRAGPHE